MENYSRVRDIAMARLRRESVRTHVSAIVLQMISEIILIAIT